MNQIIMCALFFLWGGGGGGVEWHGGHTVKSVEVELDSDL